MVKLAYPAAPTADVVDDHHGTLVPDPYRPLEDVDAPATRTWVAAQAALTGSVLAAVGSRTEIRTRLAELRDVPRAGAPRHRGTRWFQLRNTGLQDQDVLWVADDADADADADGRVLLDPNTLGSGGTTTLADVAPSPRGRYVACALSEAGSDWRTWQVLDAGTGEVLPDRITWSKFAGIAWTADEAGFFYTRYPEPPPDAVLDAANRDMELRYHRLGTDPADDPLVLATPDQPEWGFEPEVSDDGRLLVVCVWRGTDPEHGVWVADLAAAVGGPGTARPRELLAQGIAHYEHVGSVDGELYLLTDRDAPRGRVIAVDAGDATRVREVVPQGEDAIERVVLVGDRLAVISLHDATHRVTLYERDGRRVADAALPGLGRIEDAAGEREDPDLYVTFVRFAAPPAVLAIAAADGAVRAVRPAPLPWDPEAFVTELVFVASDDGTRVPLFLTRRRDLAPTGDVPTILHGYGGFQVAKGPEFKPEWLAWVERGGLFALTCLRGGSEYGSAWHDAGRLANKQRGFDDFAACARWLASSGWTRPSRIGIHGRSNGGLLVGASITQHPELFGAAVAEVGVLDMLRFHRFTIGWGWTSDYGSADDPEQFRWLIAYSPLHNLRPGTAYPPTLITTGDHDDRVVPGHSFKFGAALQATQADDGGPILVRIDTDAGHGAGKPIGKLLDERADVLAFLAMTIGDPRDARP